MKTFAAVKFVDTNEVEAVPLSWLKSNSSGTVCSWPPYKSTARLTHAITTSEHCTDDWEIFDAHIIRRCGSVLKARQICAQYVYTSDVTTSENEGKKARKVRVPTRYNDDSDNDSDQSSQPPRAKKPSKAKAPLREKQLNDLFVLPPRPQPINRLSSSAAVAVKNKSSNHREVTVMNDEHPVPHILDPQSTDPGPQIIDEPADVESVIVDPSAELVSESLVHYEPFPTALAATTISSSVNPNDVQEGQASSATAASPGVMANINQGTLESAATATPSSAMTSLTQSKLASVDKTSYRMSRCVSGMDRKLLMLLEEIKTQNTTQTLLLQQLLNAREMRVEENAEYEFGLPLSAREQLLKMEADCQDRDRKAKLTRFLSLSGGTTVAETTRNILKRLIGPTFALQCNWKGKGAKYGFSRSLLKQIVCDAVRRNPATCRAVDTEVDKAIKDWFRFAADRHGGRQRRAMKKLMEQQRSETT